MTSSLISQIENNKANHSLTTLLSIAKAFNVSVVELFQEEPSERNDVIVRSNERLQAESGIGCSFYYLTNKQFEHISFLYGIFEKDGCSSDQMMSYSDRGTEMGFVISGKLRIDIEDAVYILNPGDSICFQADKPHKISNISDSLATVIWVREIASH